MRCVLIDDEPKDLLELSTLHKKYGDLEVVGVFKDHEEAQNFLGKNKIELLLVNSEMSSMNINNFMTLSKAVQHVIFIRPKKGQTGKTYDFSEVDYLERPLAKPKLSQVISKINEGDEINYSSTSRDFAFVKDGSKVVRIDFKEILFIEALADYVQINTENDRFTVLATMKSMQANLPDDDFFRVHRSYIVRKDKIKIIEDNMILMERKNIPISRSAKQQFFNTFNFL